MNIKDPKSLQVMASVEGAAWLQQQFAGQEVAIRYGWVGAFAAFAAKQAAAMVDPSYDGDMVEEFFPGWSGVIYGAGGYARYFIMPDGDIIFDSYYASSEAHKQRAIAAGFTVR